jgi:hypothetical protein
MSPVDVFATASAGFINLPLEIGLDILDTLSHQERSRLRCVSTGSAHLSAMSLQSAAVHILSRFKLNFQDVHLMQTVMGTVISGSAVTALIRPTFDPGDLDFVTGIGQGTTVVDFIMLAAHYEVTTNSDEYLNAIGIGQMWTMKLADTLQINVIESCTSNPLDLVTTFHLSCVYGAWFANGVWHGYPRLTAAGSAVTTPCRFPVGLGGLDHHHNVWSVLHKYMQRGFTITPGELPLPHDCGKDLHCPATLRMSNNSGCSFGAFPVWAYSDEAAAIPTTCWAMGGTGCRQGILEQDVQVISSSNWSAGACLFI